MTDEPGPVLGLEPAEELLIELAETHAQLAPDGTILAINPEFATMLGYGSPEEALSSLGSFRRLVRDPVARRSLFRRLARGVNMRAELELRTATGAPCIARLYFRARRGVGGEIESIGVIADDITEIRTSEERLRVAQEQVEFAFRSSPLAQVLARIEPTGPVVVGANTAAETLLGFAPGELVGQKTARLIPDPVLDEQVARLRSSAAGADRLAIETRRRHRDGSWVEVRLTVSVGYGPSGHEYALIAIESLSEQRREEALRAAVAETMAEGLLVVDRDGLVVYCNRAASKLLGWSRSELEGLVAHELLHAGRPEGASHTGELCPLAHVRTGGEQAAAGTDSFATRDGGTLPVSYSASPIMSAEGNGTVIVFRDSTEELKRRAEVESELAALSWVGRIREALAEERLVLYAQPIRPIRGGVVSIELLIRMAGPDGQVFLPGSFLPVAERYGLIGEIDRWVLRRAVEIAAAGRRVEMNLSANSIGDAELFELIESELLRTGADPGNLVVEITETAMMGDLDTGVEFANRLVGLGCGLALDDFGTGFGSFTHVKALPIRYLKIDVEFVRDIDTNPANRNVVRAIVLLAQSFGIETIAEGVESQRVLDVLTEEGVDYAQGSYIGPVEPLEPD